MKLKNVRMLTLDGVESLGDVVVCRYTIAGNAIVTLGTRIRRQKPYCCAIKSDTLPNYTWIGHATDQHMARVREMEEIDW